MSLKAIAQETLEILDRGTFINSSGETIDFFDFIFMVVSIAFLLPYTTQQKIAIFLKLFKSHVRGYRFFENRNKARIDNVKEIFDYLNKNYKQARNINDVVTKETIKDFNRNWGL